MRNATQPKKRHILPYLLHVKIEVYDRLANMTCLLSPCKCVGARKANTDCWPEAIAPRPALTTRARETQLVGNREYKQPHLDGARKEEHELLAKGRPPASGRPPAFACARHCRRQPTCRCAPFLRIDIQSPLRIETRAGLHRVVLNKTQQLKLPRCEMCAESGRRLSHGCCSMPNPHTRSGMHRLLHKPE